MIPIEKLRAVTHLITHGPACPDGISSALIVKDALPDVKVSFMAYNTAEIAELKAEPGLLFVDFTPPRDRVAEFVAAGSICLDHHPTAKDLVDLFVLNGLGVFGLNEKNECGAWLAYEYVWRALRILGDEKARETQAVRDELGSLRNDDFFVREFAELAAIRDTWKRGDPRWEAACQQAAELIFWGFEHRSKAIKAGGIPGWAVRDERLGKHLLDKQLSAAQRALEESHSFVTTRGTRVLVFQGVSTTSDAAEIADKKPGGCEHKNVEEKTIYDSKGNHMHCRDCGADWLAYPDLVVGFHYKVDGGKLKLQFSTRSHTGYDCASFAKSHGGGGHKAAAGFTVEVSPEVSVNPYRLFELLLNEWETGQ